MVVVASNSVSLAKAALKTMLSEVAAFQTWTGTANAAAALAKIYLDGLPAPASGREYTKTELETYRPYAVIYQNEGGSGFRRDAIAVGEWSQRGSLIIRLVQDVPSQYAADIAEGDLAFTNSVGAIIDGLLAKVYDDGALVIEDIGIDSGPWRNHENIEPTQGDNHAIELFVDYGGGE